MMALRVKLPLLALIYSLLSIFHLVSAASSSNSSFSLSLDHSQKAFKAAVDKLDSSDGSINLTIFQGYSLRVTEPKICDPSVKQYSGYLDIATGKHLFFWFFESRISPSEAPLILWISGGPGCSSTFGLLFELGPCRISNGGNGTTFNPYSWNKRANIIFLDQPVNTGFSYADNGETVGTSLEAGEDVYAFLQLFLSRYPEYSSLPFHIASESYGGVFAPNFAKVIYERGRELQDTPNDHLKHINFASIIIANGLTDPYIQMGSVANYVCGGPYPIFPSESTHCASLRHATIPNCQQLISKCYDLHTKEACAAAHKYCYTHVLGSLFQSGRNVYDARQVCDNGKENGGHGCYEEASWIDTWMDDPFNKAALGAKLDRPVSSCSIEVATAFMSNGDGMHHSALLLSELVNAGVRLLVYAGDADMVCNYMGVERWVDSLDTKFKNEFQRTLALPWRIRKNGQNVGNVRSAKGDGSGVGNLTYVTVYEAGHMAGHDQPEALQDLITRWILDIPLIASSVPPN